MNREFSLITVSHKHAFVELAKASMRRRLGKEYVVSSGEEDTVWIIPDLDELVTRHGTYSKYIQKWKIPMLRYELSVFNIGKEELSENLTENLCDELLTFRVYAKALPIDLLSNATDR
jgi:hypothetical protein